MPAKSVLLSGCDQDYLCTATSCSPYAQVISARAKAFRAKDNFVSRLDCRIRVQRKIGLGSDDLRTFECPVS